MFGFNAELQVKTWWIINTLHGHKARERVYPLILHYPHLNIFKIALQNGSTGTKRRRSRRKSTGRKSNRSTRRRSRRVHEDRGVRCFLSVVANRKGGGGGGRETMDEDEKEVISCVTNATSMGMKVLQHCDFALTEKRKRTAAQHTHERIKRERRRRRRDFKNVKIRERIIVRIDLVQ